AYIDEGSLVVRIDRVEKRIQAYLAARGKFRSQLSWILYCFDFSSPDFNKKFVPYDDVVARFKTAAGFNGAPLPLQVNDMVLKGIDDVEREDLSKLPAHIQDLIAKWLSLFFHEEINADYSKESYMKRAERYFEFIYANLPGSSFAKSAKPKVDAIGKEEKDYLRARRKVKGVRWFAALFCLLPLLLVIIVGVYILITQGASELGSLMHTIGTWAGLIIGVIAGGAAFVESENLIVGGIVGAICFAVVKFCLVFITPAVPWIILGFFFIQLLLNAHAVFTSGFGSVARQYSDLTMSEGVLRAEMGKAFNCRSKLLPANLPEDYPEVIYRRDAKTLNGTFGSFVKKIIWLFIVAMGACAFCIWIYRMDPDKIDHHSVSLGVELLEGSFSGNWKGTPLDVEFSKKDEVMSANMVIKYRSGTTTQTMKSNGDDLLSFPIVMAKVDNEAITLKIDTAYIEAGTTVATGIYLNSKGNSQPVNITKK
ncbi:MAG: hypothetical protein K2K32_00030, partial [Muribaculaceae bacterium]|nr:hypothetical protein [Muribaculaceae bacterium]